MVGSPSWINASGLRRCPLARARLQGARVALLRMAREMQACLPSRRFPTSRAPAAPGVPDETNANDNDNAKEILFAHRDSGLDVVQRRYLRVAAAAFLLKRHLFRYQGVVSAELVLGGVDATGGHIYQVCACLCVCVGFSLGRGRKSWCNVMSARCVRVCVSVFR